MIAIPDSIAAVSARGRHLELFRVHEGAIEHRWWLVDNPGWTPWHRLDGPSDPIAIAAAACSDDSMTIFALSRSGQLWVRWWTLQNWWGEWESLGGPVYPPIAATSLRYGHLEVCAHSGENRLVTRYLADAEPWRWEDWQTLSDQVSTPATDSVHGESEESASVPTLASDDVQALREKLTGR